MLRWFDHWLKGDRHRDHGRADAARLDPGAAAAGARATPRGPGRWVAEPAWPPPARRRARVCTSTRRPARRRRRAGGGGPISGVQTAGLGRRLVVPVRRAGRLAGRPAGDGRHERSPSTSEPLAERFEILGFPEVTLELASDRPRALVVVRLCEVAPDGASTLVTARAPESDPPRQPTSTRAARAGRALPGDGAPRRLAATRSPPATGSGWASRRPTGRGPGPRPSRSP